MGSEAMNYFYVWFEGTKGIDLRYWFNLGIGLFFFWLSEIFLSFWGFQFKNPFSKIIWNSNSINLFRIPGLQFIFKKWGHKSVSIDLKININININTNSGTKWVIVYNFMVASKNFVLLLFLHWDSIIPIPDYFKCDVCLCWYSVKTFLLLVLYFIVYCSFCWTLSLDALQVAEHLG